MLSNGSEVRVHSPLRSVVDSIVRTLLRMKPREELPPPDTEVQRRAESGKITADFVKGRQNGNA